MKNIYEKEIGEEKLRILALDSGRDDFMKREIGKILACNWPVIVVTNRLKITNSLDRQEKIENIQVFSSKREDLIRLRINISLLGPVYLAQILELNQAQADLLALVFSIADQRGLYLYDIKDLRALLIYIGDKKKDFERGYGAISKSGLSSLIKKLVILERNHGDIFTDPSLDLGALDQELYIFDLAGLEDSPNLASALTFWLVTESFQLTRPLAIFIEDDWDLFKRLDKKLQEGLINKIKAGDLYIYLVYDQLKKADKKLLDQVGLIEKDDLEDLDLDFVWTLGKNQINQTGLRDKYSQGQDRFSAYEMLSQRREEDLVEKRDSRPSSRRRSDTSFDRFTKNVASQMGREIGRIISRTLFGNIRR